MHCSHLLDLPGKHHNSNNELNLIHMTASAFATSHIKCYQRKLQNQIHLNTDGLVAQMISGLLQKKLPFTGSKEKKNYNKKGNIGVLL